MKYAAIADWATDKQYPVTFMCAQLGVARQGYYRWLASGAGISAGTTVTRRQVPLDVVGEENQAQPTHPLLHPVGVFEDVKSGPRPAVPARRCRVGSFHVGRLPFSRSRSRPGGWVALAGTASEVRGRAPGRSDVASKSLPRSAGSK